MGVARVTAGSGVSISIYPVTQSGDARWELCDEGRAVWDGFAGVLGAEDE